MGILVNALAIVAGSLIGSFTKKKIGTGSFSIFGICVSIISLVSFIENVFEVSEGELVGRSLYVVVISLVLGWGIGELLRLDCGLCAFCGKQNTRYSGLVDTVVFFGIGGLQICGPILLAVSGDSSQLYLKSAIDLPFSVMFGAIYGRSVALSAIPVALVQTVIAVSAYFLGDFISPDMLKGLCSVGYVILFFSGFNMLVDETKKIKSVNMLPAIFVVILINLILPLLER